ncbi:hypothetical protein [Halobaculum sp. EA56]|uniref:hypothetical protein n=1 Tax=Halobaculum sp. EA56 TaxID=3421648 RepID=UPI003EB9BCEB
MDVDEFVAHASEHGFGERQAEAFYRRHVVGEGRQEVATAMETSASNVDNLERDARSKLRSAENLVALVRGAGYDDLRSVGVCAECDEPAQSLRPRPGQDDVPMDEWVMVCEDCYPADG